MRNKFEEFHISRCKALGMDLLDIKSELDRKGDGYVYSMADDGWTYWKASREAQHISLPSKETTWPDGTELVDLRKVEDAIHSQGIQC